MPDADENDDQNHADLAPKQRPGGGEEGGTLSPELRDLADKAVEYHESALSENTREAYRRGWEDFLSFCQKHGLDAAPASERAVALYLSDRAEDLATSTLSQRMAAIQHAHDERGLQSPTRSKAVQNVMRGIRRETERTSEQAPPLLTEHIKNMVDALPRTGSPPSGTEAEAAWLRGRRDRALILTGFAGAFRRSELAALRMEHIDSRPNGLLVTVPESKTDQEGEGQLVPIRRIEDSGYCPVRALRRWASVASIDDGPIFRGVPRSGFISRDAITGRTVGNTVKRAAEAAGLPQAEDYTGHSLRAGHITQASMEGAPDAAIQAQSRHESDRAFREYVRPQKLLENTSSAHLGL
ncbi:site-specific integrase [Salinibacter ruber]|uniref:site-specific integrase n=1 Tax=Salinibacter ruber TaxID=146919 RepID=UPI002168EBC3|nr:site-specific integrase [Salinibacter ruber]MCS3638950.1 integrase [Salinibacter ruber]MCS4099873.1 integrase [Salinibacter ruber]MCS4149146.1 integrase [Salinibacter ruber]